MSTFIPFARLRDRSLSKLETVDRNSLIRIGKTVEVTSLDEMEYHLDMAQDLAFNGAAIGNVSSAVFNYLSFTNNNKTEASFLAASGGYNFILRPLRLAVSTFATKEVLDSAKEDDIKKHLESIIDSYEAAILHHLIALLSFQAEFSPGFNNYRDIFSRLVSFAMDLEAGTENIYISIPTSFIYASLYETDVESTQVSASSRPIAASQWWQNERFFDTNIKFVKVPFNTGSILISTRVIIAYTDFVLKNFVRYVLNGFHIDRVTENTQERNLYRLTYDRYFVHSIPILRSNVSSRTLFGLNVATGAVGAYQFANVHSIANSHPQSFSPSDLAMFINAIA